MGDSINFNSKSSFIRLMVSIDGDHFGIDKLLQYKYVRSNLN